MIARGSAKTAIALAAVALACFLGSVAAWAQGPILTYSVAPDLIVIPSGGTAEVQVRFENGSVYEADDIAVSWAGPETFELAAEPETIKLLKPFESAILPVVLAATGATEGDAAGSFQILYTYCIGDLCYQIVETLDALIHVEAAVIEVDPETQTPSTTPETPVGPVDPVSPPDPVEGQAPGPRSFPWPWIGFAIAGLAIAGLLILGRSVARRRLVAAVLALLLIGCLTYGIVRNQHEQAQAIGSVLCISCVGLEEARSAEEAELSESGAAALAALGRDIELVLFTAEWCHACPFAKEMVELMVEATDRITLRIVDVDESPNAAVEAGIIESNRTIVPAILRTGSEDVLFGIENLEARLLDLMEVTP